MVSEIDSMKKGGAGVRSNSNPVKMGQLIAWQLTKETWLKLALKALPLPCQIHISHFEVGNFLSWFLLKMILTATETGRVRGLVKTFLHLPRKSGSENLMSISTHDTNAYHQIQRANFSISWHAVEFLFDFHRNLLLFNLVKIRVMQRHLLEVEMMWSDRIGNYPEDL